MDYRLSIGINFGDRGMSSPWEYTRREIPSIPPIFNHVDNQYPNTRQSDSSFVLFLHGRDTQRQWERFGSRNQPTAALSPDVSDTLMPQRVVNCKQCCPVWNSGTEDRPGRAQTAALQKCFLKTTRVPAKRGTQLSGEWNTTTTLVSFGLITDLCCMPHTQNLTAATEKVAIQILWPNWQSCDNYDYSLRNCITCKQCKCDNKTHLTQFKCSTAAKL